MIYIFMILIPMIYIYIYIYVRPGDRGLIPGRIIPKTLKMVLDTALRYVSRVKWSNPGEDIFVYICIYIFVFYTYIF